MAWQTVTQQIQSFFQLNPFNYVAGFGFYSYQWTGPYCTFNHVLRDYLCTVNWYSKVMYLVIEIAPSWISFEIHKDFYMACYKGQYSLN